ncbi:hypothetical protein LCGC14_2361910, partial [marine sediment metagenome]
NNYFIDTSWKQNETRLRCGVSKCTENGVIYYSPSSIKKIVVTKITKKEYNNATKE